MSKRPRSPEGGANAQSKRRSRFGDAPPTDDAAIIKAQVEARVAAISKNLEKSAPNAARVASSATSSLAQQQALELQAQVAAQLASVSSLLNSVQNPNITKKAAVHALRLDAQGREIDEFNNVIEQVAPQVKTLTANVQAEKAALTEKRKKENPYLAHRMVDKSKDRDSAAPVVGSVPTPDAAAVATGVSVADSEVPTGVDSRLALRGRRRDAHLKRALNFVQEGSYLREEEKLKEKEERRALSGYADGRKAPLKCEETEADAGAASKAAAVAQHAADFLTHVPQLSDPVPAMEWWDEQFLPKTGVEGGAGRVTMSLAQIKKQLQFAAVASGGGAGVGVQTSKAPAADKFQPRIASVAHNSSSGAGASAEETDAEASLGVEEIYKLLLLANAKTHKYVQHPVPPKPLSGEPAEDKPLPLYLTTKERKRIRKKAREEREQEKRDKQMMGLLPPEEPRFKLSNFMKVLGDQAVADPSKIEQKVIEQMRKREMNHHMRNQARKLTPQERKEKEKRKNVEDTSKAVHVAVFRVNDLSDKKKQFKVDITAQQHHLTGSVLISTNAEVPTCLVVVEGGPRGIRVFSKLMTRR